MRTGYNRRTGPARSRRASLKGWWLCIPIVAAPFCVLFFETWMQTQVLTSQYEINELTERVRTLKEDLDQMRDERYHLQRMERIEAAAPYLGLVEPEPGQLVMVRAAADSGDTPLNVAWLDEAPPAPLPQQPPNPEALAALGPNNLEAIEPPVDNLVSMD